MRPPGVEGRSNRPGHSARPSPVNPGGGYGYGCQWSANRAFLDKAWIGFHRMPTGLATQAFGVGIKCFEMLKKIFLDIVQFKVGFVQWVIAGLAKPQEPIGKSSTSPHPLDHQAQGTFFAHRRMGGPCRAQKQITGSQAVFDALPVLLGFDRDVTLQLIKDFLGFVVVVVFAGIGSGYHHHDIVFALGTEVFVSNRRPKQMPVVGQPLGEVKRGNGSHRNQFT